MSYRQHSPFAYPEVRWDGIGAAPQIRETSGITRVRDSGEEDAKFKPRPVGFTARIEPAESEPKVWEGDDA